MSDEEDVIAAARERAAAMVRGDEAALHQLLHPGFGWTSHRGDRFDRTSYLATNLAGARRWHRQELHTPTVSVVDRTAVLRCTVVDAVEVGGEPEVFVMPMTQTWVKDGDRWRCLAGHAGPRLDSSAAP